MARFAAVKFALTSLILAATIGGFGPAQARTPTRDVLQREPATVRVGELPAPAQATYELIRQGGPFPYGKDGTVFGNRERLLPVKARGYYREYTVRMSESRDRGTRRIVCGGPQSVPHDCYYTADHYGSFRKIVE